MTLIFNSLDSQGYFYLWENILLRNGQQLVSGRVKYNVFNLGYEALNRRPQGVELPVSDPSGVHMHEVGFPVEADTTDLQAAGHISQFGRAESGQTNVNGLALHMQAF